MRGLFTFALLLTLLSWKVCGLQNCTIRAIIDDQAGDGWSHNYLSFQSNGQDLVVYDTDGVAGATVTLPYGLRTVYTFSAIDSTPVTLQYHASGKYHSENLWTIQYDQDESPILHQGVGSDSGIIASFIPRCCCAPHQVTGLQVVYNADVPYSATLKWEPLDDAISYVVQRQSEDGSLVPYGEYQTNHVDLTLEPSKSYDFAVTAVSSFAHGPISDVIHLQSQDFETCTLSLQLYDNFDAATDQDLAYLSVQAGGLLAYEAFNSKVKTLDLQIPAIGDVLITPTLIAGGRDPTELEFLFADAVREYFHSGGGHFTTNTTFTVSCSDVLTDGNNLLRNEKQHLLSQQALFEGDIVEHVAPTVNNTRDLQATCQYALIMNDSRGNGWWGMSLSISLNGALWASPLYVPGQLSSFLWWFWLNDGTNVQVTFIRGTDPNPLDGSYSVVHYDNNVVGSTIVSSGGGGVLMGSTSFVSNCATSFPTTQAPQSCPTNCNSLGRNPCQSSFNPRTCGTCQSGLVANDGTTNSNSNSQCSASPTSPPTSQCPSSNTCSNLNRNQCQNNFSPRTCGTCLSGFSASDGTTNSNSNSACTQTQTCPTNCGSLNRNACQSNFNPRTCGTCLSGFTASDGTTNSNSNSACTQTQTQCPTNCPSLNRNACQNSFNPRTCGTCFNGYSANDGTTSSNSNTQCQDTNECNSSPCDSNARCTNTAGSFTCACNSGWTGDGFTCSQPQGCSGQRIRREWFSLTPAQRQLYIDAINLLYDRGQYMPFADMHSTYQRFAHGTPLFLPWHRQFLQFFEDTVRALGSPYDCFTLPYWDWTNSQTVRSIFTNAVQGGNYIGIGTKDGSCFSGSHPFAGFSYRGTCVSRSPMSTPNFPNPWTLATQLNTPSYSNIRPRIESYHNDLHVWVGNTMSQVPTSPADPVFWLHHAFVDQLWAAWESCRGYINPPALSNAWESSSGFDSTMPGWSQTPRDTWNLVAEYNVRYESVWLNRAFQGVTTFTCPSSNQQFLAAYTSPAKIAKPLQDVNASLVRSGHKGFYRTRSSFRPSRWYLAQQQAIYETFKDTYLQTQNATLALDKAFVKSCLMSPVISAAEAQMFTPEMIVMMNFEDECAAGYCVRPCFQRLMADQQP